MSLDKTPTAIFQRLIHSISTSKGVTPSAVRQAVHRYASNLRRETPDDASDLPAAVAAYVQKVALSAYKVTERDLVALQQTGYSEDAIYEITLNAAAGAAQVHMERGLAALKGEI